MAHVVGVPKRDSCQKCELPVFLAERMVVGKKIYHRTCLKCARCRSQLTPGNFYETEVDDEYCCETCPDEEERNDELLRNHNSSNGVDVRRSVRSSIAERLAFFEKSESTTDSSEPKNVSDEEKSKSLQRLGESATVSQSAFKMSAAFNDFLKSDVEKKTSSTAQPMEGIEDEEETEEDTGEESEGTSFTSTPSVILQSDVSLTEAPELPVSPPPTEQRFTTTAQLEIKLEQDNLEDNNETPLPKMKSNNIPYTLSEKEKKQPISITEESEITDKINNNDNEIVKSVTEILKEDENIEEIDLVENNITKDNTDNNNLAQISIINTVGEQINMEENIEQQSQEELRNLESENCTDEEEIKLQEEEQEVDVKIRTILNEDVATTERLSVVRERLQQFEVNNNSKETEKDELDQDNLSENTLLAPSTITLTNVPAKLEVEKSIEVPLTTKIIAVPSEMDVEQSTMPECMQETIENTAEMQVKSDLDQSLTKSDTEDVIVSQKAAGKLTIEEYPEDLNPFKSDDEEYEENKENQVKKKKDDLNPFDSSDDEIELEKLSKNSRPTSVGKVPPPRPPPPRISRNPFDEDENFSRLSSISSSLNKKTPVPTPRNNISQSSTPEPTPRINQKLQTLSNNATSLNSSTYSPNSLQNTNEYYGSATSLSVQSTPQHISRNSDMRGSCASLVSSAGGTTRSRKKTRAPLPPTLSSPSAKPTPKELFPSTETVNSSKSCSPSSSTLSSPKSGRKKRLAPPPPKPARVEVNATLQITTDVESKNSLNYPLQSESESKLCDEEKALLEGNKALQGSKRRLIPLDASLLADDEEFIESTQSQSQSDDSKQQQLNAEYKEGEVVYRRVIQPLPVETPTDEELNMTGHGRQLEKIKDNKEAQNRNRQSQLATVDDLDNLMSNLVLGYSNKSAQGKWKRRKGPAPALPVPPRKVLQMLPLQEIRHELEIIEVQQQGLEKQGVILEQMIRDRCEGGEHKEGQKVDDVDVPKSQNTKEVEDLILQLFELVNEKNELFRRQAELMYLRRQHRLEQEQADLEYEIRVLMAQPERNKTDTDKAREEALIARLVEVVQLRNDVIECLEMDRLREAEEDWSIKTTLEEHNAKREKHVEAPSKKSYLKLSKKEKKRQKEAKKLGKGSKKADADKDADETEVGEGQKQKNKKRKFSFLGNLVHT